MEALLVRLAHHIHFDFILCHMKIIIKIYLLFILPLFLNANNLDIYSKLDGILFKAYLFDSVEGISVDEFIDSPSEFLYYAESHSERKVYNVFIGISNFLHAINSGDSKKITSRDLPYFNIPDQLSEMLKTEIEISDIEIINNPESESPISIFFRYNVKIIKLRDFVSQDTNFEEYIGNLNALTEQWEVGNQVELISTNKVRLGGISCVNSRCLVYMVENLLIP